jgi:EmrB/QacA subfamily drug resistance transporter
MAFNIKNKENRILVVLFIGVLMGALDISIVSPALPAIKSYFQVDTRILIWVFNAYLLSFLIGTPFMAKLSDRSGRKKIYLLNIILFGIGSLISAFAFNFETLLIGRVIQGFGAGGIFPVASAFIGDTIAPERRGSAFGIIGTVFGLAFIIGPLLAGVILTFSWRWLFLINIPIIIALIALSIIILPKTKPDKTATFDYKGMIILAVALSLLAYGLNSVDINNFLGNINAIIVLIALSIGTAMLVILYYIEKKVEDPIILLDLFSSRQFFLTMILALGIGAVQAGIIFVPTLAILAFQLGISLASFTLLPLVVTTVIGAPLFGYILDRKGSKFVITIATIILIMGLVMLSLSAENLIIFLISGLIIGFGLSGVLGAPLRYIVLNEAPMKYSAAAQGILSINTSFGQIIGAAILGAIISSQGSQISGYSISYAFLAVVSLVMLLLSLRLKSRDEELKKLS